MKIIFLDIDGVLNWVETEDRIGSFIGLCPIRINRFNKITEAHPDVKVVISSTWRHTFSHPSDDLDMYSDFEGLISLLERRGLKANITGRTEQIGTRGDDIRDFIKKYNIDPTKDKILVLDDSSDGFFCEDDLDLTKYNIQPTWLFNELDEGGLLDKHIDEAIRALNG